ncbi:tetratricopeptide repeat protein [Bacteroidota bacterium]
MKKANEGDPLAQHELGLRYLLGKGFPKDTINAIHWIQKAVSKNVTTAKFNYGILLNNGIGVEWNPFLAFEEFNFAAKNGMPEGQFTFGIFFTDNLVVSRNYHKAFYWFEKAANSDYEPAKKALNQLQKLGITFSSDNINNSESLLSSDTSFIYDYTLLNTDWELDFFEFETESPIDDNSDESIKKILTYNSDELKSVLGISNIVDNSELVDTSGMNILSFAEKKGSPEALLISGRIHEKGILTEKDLIKAAAKYIKAYRLGANKAVEYLLNLSKSENFFDFLKQEIENKNPDAMYTWAGLTALGFDFQLSEKQAMELLQEAVQNDHVYSIIETGLCYYSGNLVEQDKLKALKYWEKAAKLGSDEARIRIAFARIQNNNMGADLRNEIQFLKSTASRGSVLAQAILAYCFEKGLGVKQDKGKAANLYRNAAFRGNQAALKSLKQMYDDIRPDKEEFEIFQ